MKLVVVGAGLGGLAAAITAAHAGAEVTLLEAAETVGGKLGTAWVDGVEVDTGPSVLTLPDVLAGLLARVGWSLGEHLRLRDPRPAFRYLFPDGARIDVHPEAEATLASVEADLGAAARAELAAFLDYAARIWTVSEAAFVRGERPGWGTLFRRPLRDWPLVFDIDPFRTMDAAIHARVQDPHLRTLLRRYATYNGSDVRRAPAALNCIAHVELGLGGHGVEGGVHTIARVLEQAARRLGVHLRLGARVSRIGGGAGRVEGVELETGTWLPADAVVWNGEVAALPALAREVGWTASVPAPDSTSGWTGILRARRRVGAEARVAHTVLFPADYTAEFVDLFDRRRVPVDPTVYLCAQEACHGRPGWAEEEPVFLMINAPAGAELPDPAALGAAALGRLRAAGLAETTDQLVWTRTPAELAARFPGSRGALYGQASNDAFSGFRRPANRVAGIRGLYLAGGSAHPGGGMPLVMLSGEAAARAAAADFGLGVRVAS